MVTYMELSSTAASACSSHTTVHSKVRCLVVVVVVLVVSSQFLPLLLRNSPDRPVSLRFLAYSLSQKPRPSGKTCVMFNFGDSNSDTGGLVAGMGIHLHKPFGRQFFGKPSGRFSDGRLYIDFICERLGLDHLSPYLESSGVTFRHGANFAVAGGTAGPAQHSFSLWTQVRQFRHFKRRTADLLYLGRGPLITAEEFQKAVYSLDIGQNDISVRFRSNQTYEHILQTIPAIIISIKNAVTMVYEKGGRKFIIYNTGPIGCLPNSLVLRRRQDSDQLDHAGCLVEHNNIAKALNAQLSHLCGELRSKFPNTTIVCVDMYTIKYELFANHTIYGFINPLMACCGSGGSPYNYNSKMTCGNPKVKPCSDGSRYISWDGVHYTEAANKIVADKILSLDYNNPRIPLQTLCNS